MKISDIPDIDSDGDVEQTYFYQKEHCTLYAKAQYYDGKILRINRQRGAFESLDWYTGRGKFWRKFKFTPQGISVFFGCL